MPLHLQTFLLFFIVLNLFVMVKAFIQCYIHKNAFGLTYYLNILGIFAWGDAIIFAPFWALVSAVALTLQDWTLFLLIFSLFWLVRSLGETIYWFNQQFSTLNRNPPEKLPGFKFFHNDSIWYIYQIFWQCVTVVSAVFSLYFSKLWLASF